MELFCQSFWLYLAGFVAAIIAIGPLWYLVHYKGMVQLKTGDIGVDMGFGIATAVFIRDALDYGWTGILKSFPTLLLVVIGAALGGFGAYCVERLLSKKREGKSDH
ncbi:Lin0368 family putative glycerol transporter subunit [Streptococcus huangxiaojuni]|uniref:Lin0368 family putative glycerol transporter subunit n=1 Tax=Streptococcus huangxiaojuni TaxID=3237239 RepID=UPI003F600734